MSELKVQIEKTFTELSQLGEFKRGERFSTFVYKASPLLVEDMESMANDFLTNQNKPNILGEGVDSYVSLVQVKGKQYAVKVTSAANLGAREELTARNLEDIELKRVLKKGSTKAPIASKSLSSIYNVQETIDNYNVRPLKPSEESLNFTHPIEAVRNYGFVLINDANGEEVQLLEFLEYVQYLDLNQINVLIGTMGDLLDGEMSAVELAKTFHDKAKGIPIYSQIPVERIATTISMFKDTNLDHKSLFAEIWNQFIEYRRRFPILKVNIGKEMNLPIGDLERDNTFINSWHKDENGKIIFDFIVSDLIPLELVLTNAPVKDNSLSNNFEK